MDFFAHQAKVRRSSRWLVVLFVLAVLAVIAAVDVVVVLAFGLHGSVQSDQLGPGQAPGFIIDWPTVAMVSVAVLVLIVLASMYRMASLRGGGAVVAQGMGATPVPTDTTNPAWRRLRNIIEEIAIASSVPVPDIYVMEQETGINAFAAGYTPSDAAVCVTQGCLERLNRDELQGVIAHEFSHVLNGDMRLNIRLMGLLFGILVIGIVGRFMLYSGAGGRVRSRDNNGTASLAMIGIAVVIVGYIGFFFGRLIQAAVSRSRESLADASAVQFTRQTRGIAGALKKIAALQEGSQLAAHNKQEVAHMLFGEAGRFSSLFATHPPLPERLQALGVKWDEKEIEALARAWQQPRRAVDPERATASTSVAGFAPQQVVGMAAAAPASPAEMPEADAGWQMSQAGASSRVGQPAMADFDLAGLLRDRLPTNLREAGKDPHQARALLLALAMDRGAGVRDAQLLTIDHALGSDCAEDADRMLKMLVDLHPMQRLPLAALLFPALRRRPRPELEKLLDLLDKLVHADNQVDLHEYCLVRLLGLQLRDLLDPSASFTPGRHRLRQHRDSFAALCAIVAASGDENMQVAERAYRQAMQRTLPNHDVAFAVDNDWQTALDRALSDLDSLRAPDKQLAIDGLATAISADGMVTVPEAELLRVICAALHCPLPLLHARSAATA